MATADKVDRYPWGESEMAQRVRAHDWTSNPLGPPDRWPSTLRSTFATLLETPHLGTLLWGPELRMLYNDDYAPALGDRHPEALGRPLAVVWGDIWDQLAPTFLPVLETGRAVSDQRLPLTMFRDGELRLTYWSYSVSPIRDDDGHIVGLMNFALDITLQVEAEQRQAALIEDIQLARTALETSNADLEAQVKERTASLRLFENIVQSDASPICAYDTSYRVIAYNKAHDDDYRRVMGRKAELGEVLPDAFEPEQATALRSLIDRALSGEAFHVEAEFGDADLTVPHWELDFAPVHDEQGRLIGAFHHARDITSRLSMEAELASAQEAMRQAQKMEAVGQLTGGVAHDFNNLLTVIKGSVELLRRPNLSDERRNRYVEAIGDTAERASKLTSQLLAFSRRSALKPETFDVMDSLDHVVGIVGALTGVRIELEVVRARIPLVVTTDRSQFDTAIVNMAVNARDAMDGEGRLTIAAGAASNIPPRRGHPPLTGDFVALAITDTGKGIPEADLARVFEPFYTTKGVGHGTGLGLSQVIGFAKQAGGDVLVESRVGQGSTFTLYLPRVYAEADTATPGQEESVDGNGFCVLLVEDNESVGEFATDALRELGYDSVLARSAQEALDELARDYARFHVVFSDVVMPGLSGLAMAEIIRREYPNTPIILTSGYSHVLAQNGQHGFELLHKPYSVEQLSRVLRKAVSWRQATASR